MMLCTAMHACKALKIKKIMHAFPTCSFSRADHEKQCERFLNSVNCKISQPGGRNTSNLLPPGLA